MADETRERISGWILEFLTRNPNTDNIAKRAIHVLPFPSADDRFKRTIYLRTIECELFEATFTEKTLQSLEVIAALDGVGPTMSAAYRAVAVEITVRVLVGAGGNPSSKYLDKVDRIWRVRVGALEEKASESGLLTSDLRHWRDEVEAAVWDEAVAARLAAMNTRNDAVAAVGDYLKEAWDSMGKVSVVRFCQEKEKEKEKEKEVRVSREESQSQREISDGRKSLRGVIAMAKKAGLLGLNGDKVRGNDNVVGLDDSPVVLIADDEPASNVTEHDGKNVVKRNKRVALHRRYRGPAKISDIDEDDSDTNPSNKMNETLSASEVNKVGEALKSSSLELKKPATDPLPSALETAGSSDLAIKNAVNEPISENQNIREAGETSRSVHKPAEPVVSKEANPGNPSCSQKNDVAPRSLMERNSTAHTLEWGDSPAADRYDKSWLQSPISKKRVVSPLEYKPAKVSKRRTVKRWTLLEEDILRTGVEKFGKGNWKLILNCYREEFAERTEVDLKDKWRNMTK